MSQTRVTSFGRMKTLRWGKQPKKVELLQFKSEGKDHSHSEWENAVLIEGKGEIIVDGETYPAYEGLIFSIPPGLDHHMRPLGEEPSSWLIWYTDHPARLFDV